MENHKSLAAAKKHTKEQIIQFLKMLYINKKELIIFQDMFYAHYKGKPYFMDEFWNTFKSISMPNIRQSPEQKGAIGETYIVHTKTFKEMFRDSYSNILTVEDIIASSSSFAIGDGLMSKEFYDSSGDFLFEIVCPNGTREDEEAGAGYNEQYEEKSSRSLTSEEIQKYNEDNKPQELPNRNWDKDGVREKRNIRRY